MYIKQIIIEGFKSYRDRTVVETFDRRHNVVVGRNGSGKSNFFAAIQFVLSDEFSHLRTDQRQSLLHEGIGPRVISAYVELIFDNTDGRLPFDKTEVHLRRMIGSKKDSYFLNKTNVPRCDVMNLLESAGFSKSNPYYIVKQGEINQMATATDSERLRLLREIAGTRVYDERTQESRTIIQESQTKLEKAGELLGRIEERLQALEAEKDELKEYQRWEKQRRCLEYTIYQRESNENKRKLEALNKSNTMSIAEQQTLGRVAKAAQENISAVTERWRNAKAEVDIAKHGLNMRSEENQQLIQKATKLSLEIKDLREEIKNKEDGKASAEAELQDLEQRINEKMKELETINPEYEKLIKEEEELKRNLTLKEQQRKELYVKKGRKHQFNCKEDRDEWIQEQLNQLAKQIQDKQTHCQEIQDNLTEDRERQQTLENKINKQIREIEQQKKSIEKYEIECYKEIADKEKVQSELKELYRRESTIEAMMSTEEENLAQIEQSLRFLFGKQVINGRESIRKVLNTFRAVPGPSGEVDCYCGQVIDNFSCEEGVYTAVEVIAGKRLFHHIVENDAFSTKILKEMNRQELPGEVTFMPLNRLKVITPHYPTSGDAIPMIAKLIYDEKYDIAMRFIFGKTLICRNLEIATKFARETGLDCVTLDGDLVSSKGFLTGGYYNRERTPLGDYKTRSDIEAKIFELKSKLEEVKAEISRLTQTFTSQVNKIQRLESLIRKTKNTYEIMEVDISGMKTELSNIHSYRIPNERSLAQCMASLEGMEATKKGWERELNQDLSSQLSPGEHELLDTLNEDIRNLSKQSKIVFEKRMKAEKEKTKLDNLLTNNLTRRRDELTQMLQEMSAQDPQRQLKLYLSQLANVEEQRKKIENEIKTLNEVLIDTTKTLKSHSDELEKWKIQKKDVLESIEENARNFEKFTSKTNIIEQKIAEITEKIATLGALPSQEAYEKFMTMPNKLLFKELDKTNNQLKKYSHVNKKALDQFVSFTDQRDKLVKRKEELDRGNEKIEELMAALEQQKYEAIQFTFKEVSKYFSEIFKRLAPSGHARLVMKTANTENTNGNDESGSTDFNSFVGVGIRVSFTGRETETNEMNQLSGGQKSLVALALIFAIQKCDPAPFYLFDEIDQALDTHHREAVAAMIHELSSEAQFIITTFKPEMLRFANKFYGVKFGNKVSHINCITQEEAADFVGDAMETIDGQ